MKAKKITMIASVLLTASIAFMTSACTIEFSDPEGTIDKVVEAVSEGEINVELESSDDTDDTQAPKKGSGKSSSSTETKDTDATASEEITSNESTEDTEATETTETTETAKTKETKPFVVGEDCCYQFDVYDLTLNCEAGSFAVKAGDTKVIITYNGKDFTLPISWDNKQVWPYAPVYIQSNGKAYLYVQSSLESGVGFHHNTNVYRVEADNITYVGSVEGVTPVTQKMSEPSGFLCSEVEAEELGMYIRRLYKVGDDGMPVPIDNIRYFESPNVVTFKEDWTGYIVKDGTVTSEEITIPAGTFVCPAESDGETYFQVWDKEGNAIRLDWSSIFSTCDKSDVFYVANAILSNSADRKPHYEF